MTEERLKEIEDKYKADAPYCEGECGDCEPPRTCLELIAEVRRLTSLAAERDAYKRAKEENDERFMRERDEAREEGRRLRAPRLTPSGQNQEILSLRAENAELKEDIRRLNAVISDADEDYAHIRLLRQKQDEVLQQLLREAQPIVKWAAWFQSQTSYDGPLKSKQVLDRIDVALELK